MGQKNIVVAVLLLAVAGGYGFMAFGLPERTVPNTPGPSFFPWVITALIAGLSAALLWQGVRAMQGSPLRLDLAGIDRRAALTVGVFALFLALLPHAGFLAAGIPFTAAMIRLFGGRGLPLILAGSVAMPVALFFLFREVFSILLPVGWLSVIGG